MQSTFYRAQAAIESAHACFGRSAISMSQAMAASTSMLAATSTNFLQTGVVTSVSLFVLILVLSIVFLLLPGLVVLISLLLIGLTGLVTLVSLVGHEIERTIRTAVGE
jgi:hypothetical protein